MVLLGLLGLGFVVMTASQNSQIQSTTIPETELEISRLTEEEYNFLLGKYLQLLEEQDPRAALDSLRLDSSASPAVVRDCHFMVHELGRAAYEKYDDFATAFQYHDGLCTSGYLHGVIEQKFSESEEVFADLTATCSGSAPETFLGWECRHGIGHGLMFYSGNDLPESLELCSELKTEIGQLACANGAFMENFNVDQKIHLSKYINPEDPFYPCQEQTAFYKHDCYHNSPIYFLSLSNSDYRAALDWCTQAENGYQSICARGVSGQAMEENIHDVKQVEGICQAGPAKYREACVEGLVSSYVSYFGQVERAQPLCEQLEIAHRSICQQTLASFARMFPS